MWNQNLGTWYFGQHALWARWKGLQLQPPQRGMKSSPHPGCHVAQPPTGHLCSPPEPVPTFVSTCLLGQETPTINTPGTGLQIACET